MKCRKPDLRGIKVRRATLAADGHGGSCLATMFRRGPTAMSVTDVTRPPNTAPTTRPTSVHYPAYYLGRPAAWYLAVYSCDKDRRSGPPGPTGEGISARPSTTTSVPVRARRPVETVPPTVKSPCPAWMWTNTSEILRSRRARAEASGSGRTVHRPSRQGVEI